MTLPLHDRAKPILFVEQLETSNGDARPPVSVDADWRLRVLIVEDEEVVRSVLQEMLRSYRRCRIELAASGAEALALLENDADFDLVLSDIRMPAMNGTEFYQRLKQNHPALARRFVFVTGHAGSKALEEEIDGWGVPVLAKPFTLARLVAMCGPYLERVSRPATV
jgi:two-component system NtrC family sensor kinase